MSVLSDRCGLTLRRQHFLVPIIGAATVFTSRDAEAHTVPARGVPGNWHELAGDWILQPVIVIPLLLFLLCYLRGLARLGQRNRSIQRQSRFRLACFLSGYVTLGLAILSPLHAWGSALFCVHMIQHELLMLVVAPLLILGRPVVGFLWGLPRPWAMRLARLFHWSPFQSAWGILSHPVVAWLVHAVVLWLWHVPAAFAATLSSDVVHAAQHSSFLGSALLFWHALLYGRYRAGAYGSAILYLFTTGLHTGLLGALLSLSPMPWYEPYQTRAPLWGLSGLEDQQIGGLIMWIPAGAIYLGVALALFVLWLRESERRAEEHRAQRFQTAQSVSP